MCTYSDRIEFNTERQRRRDKLHKIPIKVPEALQIKCAQCMNMCTNEHTVNHQHSRCSPMYLHLWPTSFIVIFEFVELKRQTSINDCLLS